MSRRFILYYLIGLVIGIGLICVIWWASPSALQADRTEQSPVQLADVRRFNEQITVGRHNAITIAVSDVSPAVVGINVISVREYRSRDPFFNDPFFRGLFPPRVYRQKVENLGSGFIVSPDGYIFTNQHVVHGATQVVVTTTSGEEHDAEIIGYDFDSDIALLKIDGDQLPFIRFGDSDSVIIGEWAIAIGNPFGLFSIHSQPTVTVGVVSAADRDFDRNDEGRLYQDMIQTDAAINRGNSGGPLVNSAGDLIGMNTMIFTESGGSIGLGFAIPSNRLRATYEELRVRGRVDRDFWIGLEIQNVTRLIAVGLRLSEVRGVVVTEVESGSPAATAGVEVADVILEINGRRSDDTRSAQMILRNSDLRVGDTLNLAIIRDSEQVEKIVILEQRRD
ncbi:MAG: trypsin-like peptidase domain-containing protein [Candidatus Electryoneaceae bacterium]|nr:trypsin-like peptidase domain-containing protein [Candidatus Electryoneaceae bacterium]